MENTIEDYEGNRLVEGGYMTLDEARKEMGLPPLYVARKKSADAKAAWQDEQGPRPKETRAYTYEETR